MKWKDKLINDIENYLKDDKDWSTVFSDAINVKGNNIHLAVFNEPFLTMIFIGIKTVESRFSLNKVAPFGKIARGDIVLMKENGGPVVGFFVIDWFLHYTNINADKLTKIERLFRGKIGWVENENFLKMKETSKFLTLIGIGNIKRIDGLETTKKDRLAWTVLKMGFRNTLFDTKGLYE